MCIRDRFSSLDWNDARRLPPAFRHDLKIIHETPEYPRALEMVRGDLDPKVEARLREVLLQACLLYTSRCV